MVYISNIEKWNLNFKELIRERANSKINVTNINENDIKYWHLNVHVTLYRNEIVLGLQH